MTSPIARALKPSTVAALLAVAIGALLLAPGAQAQSSVPTLQSTPQYKALVDYVGKLRGLRTTPATQARKDAYTATLTKKHGDAVAKSTALFNRGKKRATIATTAKFKKGVATVRADEAASLQSVRDEYGQKLINAATKYNANVDSIENTYDLSYERLRREIQILRDRKAKAKGIVKKQEIQERINVVIKQVAERKRDEFEDLQALEERYRAQKQAIVQARAEEATSVRSGADEDVDELSAARKRQYDRKVAALQAKRQSQLADLERKLDAGRAYIAEIPLKV